MPGVEPLGCFVGLAYLQQDIGTAHLSGGGDELDEHEGGDPSSARGRDGGDGQQVRAGQAAGVIETGVAQEPRPVQSDPAVTIRSVIGSIGLDDDVAAVRPGPVGGLQLGSQQVTAPGLGPEQLTLEAGDKANTLKGTLNFRGVDYKLILPYDPATGTITFVGQPLHDPTNKYAGGVVLIPISLADGRKLLSTDHSITFTWDEDQQQAIAKGSEMADGKVDSFFGVAYGEDLKPVVDKNGNYVFPIAMENIQFLKKSN